MSDYTQRPTEQEIADVVAHLRQRRQFNTAHSLSAHWHDTKEGTTRYPLTRGGLRQWERTEDSQ